MANTDFFANNSPRYDANGVLITDGTQRVPNDPRFARNANGAYANGTFQTSTDGPQTQRNANGHLITVAADGEVVVMSGPDSGRANATHTSNGSPRFTEKDADGNRVTHAPLDLSAQNAQRAKGQPMDSRGPYANGSYANGQYANGQSQNRGTYPVRNQRDANGTWIGDGTVNAPGKPTSYPRAGTYVNASGTSVTDRRSGGVNNSAFTGSADRRK